MGRPKKKVGDMGKYTPNKEDTEAYIWCVRNGIHISPLARSAVTWYIDIEINGNTARDPNEYGPTDIWVKLYEYYRYYYKKRKE
jgi:hypothetical protein